MTKPKVLVLALGGTIATARSEGGGLVPGLTGEMLAASVPALQQVAQIEARTFRQLPSADLQFEDLEALVAEIGRARAEGVTGVVVTQGTDTIEESAFALDCLLQGSEMPVVVTGAMRNPTLPGADGPANLLAAVQVCVSPDARGLGCLVVFNDEIHASRFVRKTHTSSTATFASPSSGPLGWVLEGQVRFVLTPRALEVPRFIGPARPVRVPLVALAMGDDDTVVRALLAAGVDGLVVLGMGGGHAPAAVTEALQDAARVIPVVIASRALAGETLSRTYGFTGGEIDLQRRGLIRAGWLDALKARVLLTLMLRHGQDRAGIDAAFAPWRATALAGAAT